MTTLKVPREATEVTQSVPIETKHILNDQLEVSPVVSANLDLRYAVEDVLNEPTFPLSVTGGFWDSTVTTREERQRIRTLEARVAALEEEVQALKRVTSESQESEVIVLRTIPRDQAKEEIRQLFAFGGTLYYSDIVRRLGLDIALVVDLCKELEADGEVMTVADAT